MSPSKRHRWAPGHRPILEDHSKAKHRMFSDYIQEYLKIMCQIYRMEKFNITIVDGFAGGGMYRGDEPGSPIVIMEAVNKAIADINNCRSKPININQQYFFIEKYEDTFASLEQTLKGNRHSPNLINEDFNTALHKIAPDIRARHPQGGGGVIFVLDQEGYASVDMTTINKIRLSFRSAEIILTFAISWLVDFIGNNDILFKQSDKLGLLEYLDVDEIIGIKDIAKDWRNIIESKLAAAIQKATAFPFSRPFFIQPQNNHRGYWLLHLAQHYRAHNAMTDTIWKNGNYMRHFGGSGMNLFDIYYRGGHKEAPYLFGKTFIDEAWHGHKESLIDHLPRHIRAQEKCEVQEIIRNTCNKTAAPMDMYYEVFSQLREDGEIIITGKSGGNKRGGKITLHDRVIPQKQLYFF